MNVSQALAMNMMRRADDVEAEPQAKMHQGMELPPAVVIGVEEEGLEEEQQDVREKRRGEHAHHVVRELRIQDDEHERQRRSEGRGQREGDGEELRELVREPVVSPDLRSCSRSPRRSTRRLGRPGRTPRTAGAAARPPRWPRGFRRRGTFGTWPLRRASPGPFSPRPPSRRPAASALTAGAWARAGSWCCAAPRDAIVTAPANITRPATGPRRTSSVRFVTAPPSMADRGRTAAPRVSSCWKDGGDVASRMDASPHEPSLAGAEGSGPLAELRARLGTRAQAASPRWNSDATSSPLQSTRRRGTIEIRRIEAAILPMNSDEGQARDAAASKFLTAAVTGRMKIPSASQNDSVLSSSGAARTSRCPRRR